MPSTLNGDPTQLRTLGLRYKLTRTTTSCKKEEIFGVLGCLVELPGNDASYALTAANLDASSSNFTAESAEITLPDVDINFIADVTRILNFETGINLIAVHFSRNVINQLHSYLEKQSPVKLLKNVPKLKQRLFVHSGRIIEGEINSTSFEINIGDRPFKQSFLIKLDLGTTPDKILNGALITFDEQESGDKIACGLVIGLTDHLSDITGTSNISDVIAVNLLVNADQLRVVVKQMNAMPPCRRDRNLTPWCLLYGGEGGCHNPNTDEHDTQEVGVDDITKNEIGRNSHSPRHHKTAINGGQTDCKGMEGINGTPSDTVANEVNTIAKSSSEVGCNICRPLDQKYEKDIVRSGSTENVESQNRGEVDGREESQGENQGSIEVEIADNECKGKIWRKESYDSIKVCQQPKPMERKENQSNSKADLPDEMNRCQITVIDGVELDDVPKKMGNRNNIELEDGYFDRKITHGGHIEAIKNTEMHNMEKIGEHPEYRMVKGSQSDMVTQAVEKSSMNGVEEDKRTITRYLTCQIDEECDVQTEEIECREQTESQNIVEDGVQICNTVDQDHHSDARDADKEVDIQPSTLNFKRPLMDISSTEIVLSSELDNKETDGNDEEEIVGLLGKNLEGVPPEDIVAKPYKNKEAEQKKNDEFFDTNLKEDTNDDITYHSCDTAASSQTDCRSGSESIGNTEEDVPKEKKKIPTYGNTPVDVKYFIKDGRYMRSFTVGKDGGRCSIKKMGVCLVVPQNALDKDTKLFLGLSKNGSDIPSEGPDGGYMYGPVLVCGPHGLTFKVPVYLVFQHSLFFPSESNVKLPTFYQSETFLSDKTDWKEFGGKVMVSRQHAMAVIGGFTKYVWRSVDGQPLQCYRRLRIMVFKESERNDPDTVKIRVYPIDAEDGEEQYVRVHERGDLAESATFLFDERGNYNLTVRLDSQNDTCTVMSNNVTLVAFEDILSNSQGMRNHCKFTLQRKGCRQALKCTICVSQDNGPSKIIEVEDPYPNTRRTSQRDSGRYSLEGGSLFPLEEAAITDQQLTYTRNQAAQENGHNHIEAEMSEEVRNKIKSPIREPQISDSVVDIDIGNHPTRSASTDVGCNGSAMATPDGQLSVQTTNRNCQSLFGISASRPTENWSLSVNCTSTEDHRIASATGTVPVLRGHANQSKSCTTENCVGLGEQDNHVGYSAASEIDANQDAPVQNGNDGNPSFSGNQANPHDHGNARAAVGLPHMQQHMNDPLEDALSMEMEYAVVNTVHPEPVTSLILPEELTEYLVNILEEHPVVRSHLLSYLGVVNQCQWTSRGILGYMEAIRTDPRSARSELARFFQRHNIDVSHMMIE